MLIWMINLNTRSYMYVLFYLPYMAFIRLLFPEDKEAERKKLRARLRIKQAQLKGEEEGTSKDSSKFLKVNMAHFSVYN